MLHQLSIAYIYSRAYTLQDMKRREKACLQKNAQSSGTTASLITSAPVQKKKWEGRKCQRLLWEWKGDQGGEGFQSRKRKRRIRPPAPLPDSEAPIFPISGSETSFISFQPPTEGRRHISGSQLAEKQERLPNVVQLCATTTLTGTKIHKSCVIV